jgi:hypothetical protein
LHCKAIDKTKQKLEYLQNPATFSGATDARTTATTKEDSEERNNTFLALTLLLRRF